MEDAAPLVIPFSWEEKPGVPKQPADDHIALGGSNYRGYGHDYGYDSIDGAAGLQLATSLMPPLRKPPRMEAAAVMAGGAIDTKAARGSHGRTASSVGENPDRRIVPASAIASRTHHKSSRSSSNISHRPKLISIKDDPFLLAIQACTTTTTTTFIRSASSSSLSHDRHRYNNSNTNYPHQYNNPNPNSPHHNNIRHHYHRRCNTDMQAAQSSPRHDHRHQDHLTIAQLLSREKMLELEEDNKNHHHHELTRHMQREPLLPVGDAKNSLRIIRSYKSQLTLQLRHHGYDSKPSIFARCFGCIL